MQIELLLNENEIIVGFRHGWSNNSKNPPISKNIVNLYSIDYEKFKEVLENHVCIKATEEDTGTVHFGTGFYLKIIA